MGLGIAAEMAVRDVLEDDGKIGLVARPAGHLFGTNITRVAFKRSAYLRNCVYTFASFLNANLTRSAIEDAMHTH